MAVGESFSGAATSFATGGEEFAVAIGLAERSND